jgi:hypothetical protein
MIKGGHNDRGRERKIHEKPYNLLACLFFVCLNPSRKEIRIVFCEIDEDRCYRN